MGQITLFMLSKGSVFSGIDSKWAWGNVRILLTTVVFCSAVCLATVPVLAQTELGSEDDLTVLGTNGTALDPDTEIKGFTVFGSAQSSYTGASAAPGHVVVNGVLAVSSGAYFVGNSTFTGAGKIFVNDGNPGQLLRKNSGGYLEWSDISSIGDNLGNHTATARLNMAGYSADNVSSVTVTGAGVAGTDPFLKVAGSTVVVLNDGRVGIGTAVPGAKLHVNGDVWLGNDAISSKVGALGDVLQVAADADSNSGGGPNIQFLTGASEKMRITSGGSVGIGAASPAAKLHVSGSGPEILLEHTGGDDLTFTTSDGAGLAGIKSSGKLSISYGGQDTIMQRGGGNVGIGTPGPGAKLSIAPISWAASQNGGIELQTPSGEWKWGIKARSTAGASPYLTIAGPADASGGMFDMMTFGVGLNQGNVGISTGAPQARLDVLAGGAAPADMAQIWRDSSGVIVGSMSATGVMKAVKILGDISGATGLPSGDNLGNHTASQNLKLSGYWLSNDGGDEGIMVDINGQVGIGTQVPSSGLSVHGVGVTGGILVYDASAASASPMLEVRGRRIGVNTSQTFGGGVALAGLVTDGPVPAGKRLGTIYFGGNHTDATESNLLYSASLSGVADGAFSDSGVMPTGIAFYTGSTGTLLGQANVSYGTERMRINYAGNVGIGVSAPASLLQVGGTVSAERNVQINDSGVATFRYDDNSLATNVGLHNRSITDAGHGTAIIFALANSGAAAVPAGRIGAVSENATFSGVTADAALSFFVAQDGSLSERLRISSVGDVGLSYDTPQARLDIRSGGSTPGDMGTIWRNSVGTVVSSVSATGVMMASKFIGDGSGLSGVSGASPVGSALTSANIWVGNVSNLAAAVVMSGDATLNDAGALTLGSVGTAGTYRSVTTDAKGRVTAGTNPTTFAGYGISDTSANLAAAITNETGTGALVFGTAPTFTTSANSPVFQGAGAAVTFGNAAYATTVAGSGLTVAPTAWTAVPTISGLITATSGLTANGALTANGVFTLGDGGNVGSINTSDWDISTTGSMTGISGIANNGAYTQTGTSVNSFTGAVAIGLATPEATLDVRGNVKLDRYFTQVADSGMTLTTADFGSTITVDNSADVTINLPAVTASHIGATITVVKLGIGKVTINAPAGTFIMNSSDGGTAYCDSISPYGLNITLRLVNSTLWAKIAGDGVWSVT